MTDAARAMAARRFADILADLLLELPDDVTHFAGRTVAGVVLDAAHVRRFEWEGSTRTWTFTDGLVVEEGFDDDPDAVVEANRAFESLAAAVLRTTDPQDFTVSLVTRLCTQVGLVADIREADDPAPIASMWGPTLRFEVEP